MLEKEKGGGSEPRCPGGKGGRGKINVEKGEGVKMGEDGGEGGVRGESVAELAVMEMKRFDVCSEESQSDHVAGRAPEIPRDTPFSLIRSCALSLMSVNVTRLTPSSEGRSASS